MRLDSLGETMNELYDMVCVDERNMDKWKQIVEDADQSSIFIDDDYLKQVGFIGVKYLIIRKGKPFMGLCIPVDCKTGMSTTVVPYAPYQGFLYTRNGDSYSDYSSNLDATTLLLEKIYEDGNMKKVAFGNHYTVKDMRAVQWHHYHQPKLGMYRINLRYTAMIDLTDDTWENRLSKGRRLDYKYSQNRYGLSCEISYDTSKFIELYDKTFFRQGIDLPDNELDTVRRITQLLLQQKKAILSYAVDSNGNYYDAVVVAYHKSTGYYLFGANDPEHRDYGGGTLLLMHQMKKLKENGIREFDFIGVNSPQRGGFKLSFGGMICPYYTCEVDYE